MVGDGSYLMMAQELATAVQEHVKLTVVLVQNHGFASIGALSESLGSQRVGTKYRYRDPSSGLLEGGVLPVDLAANAASLGAQVIRAEGVDGFRKAVEQARAATTTTVVHIETDLYGPNPPGQAWWDVPVSEVAELESTRAARAAYEAAKRAQRPYL
jgi:3D-(3,5/4)-trihydroxycyclohexane-1,2-dione acylhydrolase (decyclizing)